MKNRAKSVVANNKTEIQKAWIGAVAPIAVAIIAGLFAILAAHFTKAPDPALKTSDNALTKPPEASPKTSDSVKYSGRVTNKKTGLPIRDIAVKLEEDTGLTTYTTDENGVFEVTLNTNSKIVRLIVEESGYKSINRLVDFNRTGMEPIELTPVRSPESKVKRITKHKHDNVNDEINRLFGKRDKTQS
jgi:hypothetical protein